MKWYRRPCLDHVHMRKKTRTTSLLSDTQWQHQKGGGIEGEMQFLRGENQNKKSLISAIFSSDWRKAEFLAGGNTPFARGGGVLSGKVGTGMCGPDRVLFQALRFCNGPFFIDIGRVFAKCIIYDEFVLWFIYRLSKSTYASQFTL